MNAIAENLLLSRLDKLSPEHQEDLLLYVEFLLKKQEHQQKPKVDLGSGRLPLEFGAAKHLITYMSDDFDAPLDDFQDYM